MDLWLEVGKLGYLGVNIPEEYGEVVAASATSAAVCEELAAQGCPLLMMIVSPAICARSSAHGTPVQKARWLFVLADGTATMASRSPSPTPARTARDHDDCQQGRRRVGVEGGKVFISAMDEAANVFVVARAEDAKTGKLKPCLFVVPTLVDGLEFTQIPMEIVSPEKQFSVFIEDVRLPQDALIGDEDTGLVQLFAGLNPERIMAASFSMGMARYALDKATAYAKERIVFQSPIGSTRPSRTRSPSRRSRSNWPG